MPKIFSEEQIMQMLSLLESTRLQWRTPCVSLCATVQSGNNPAASALRDKQFETYLCSLDTHLCDLPSTLQV